jgi:SAM-dependent methyltransferase
VVDAVLREVPREASEVLDLGCGTGALALRLAPSAAHVLAVDISPGMTEALGAEATARRLDNITTITAAAEALELAPASLDAVVSNYALHHLRDRDKERVVRATAGWVRPGGRLVIGDMMFSRGASRRDRRIIAAKVRALAHKGPGGWWRIVKNTVRFSLRLQERPLTIDGWVALLEDAGFVEVSADAVVAEAAVVCGSRPSDGGAAQGGAPGQPPPVFGRAA